ncbi:hypothetical protein TNCT_462641 [Trichonephila clavata]|uniref:Uncharacterized protein n=1 Tax=Trichonephila clavata TaxID=2740835 RepID=A0A8X6KY92_TRICU|nr:hypothetical protein TNCT_462641 [Trichonephila clavata]
MDNSSVTEHSISLAFLEINYSFPLRLIFAWFAMDSEKKDQKETPMDEEGAASTSEAAASTSEAAASTSEAAASSSEAAASSSEAAASTSEAAASTSEGTGSPEAAASTSTRVPKKAWTTADTHNVHIQGGM